MSTRITANQFQKRIARKPAKNEHCLQRAVVKWCNGMGAGIVRQRFFAVPNGGARDIITAARLKAEGARSGVPDLVFFGPGGSVLWVEMKNGTSGVVSAAQKAMHAMLNTNDHVVVVCRSLSDAVFAVTQFFGGHQ